MAIQAKLRVTLATRSLAPEKDFAKSPCTEQWLKRKMSNFEYLMCLNHWAGVPPLAVCHVWKVEAWEALFNISRGRVNGKWGTSPGEWRGEGWGPPKSSGRSTGNGAQGVAG